MKTNYRMTTTKKAHKTMITTRMLVMGFLLAALPAGVAIVSAAAPETPLTAAGQKLEARYAEKLKALQAEVTKALPPIDEAKKAAFLAAAKEQPPFPRPPVFAEATTGRPVRPNGSFRGLPQKANS